MPGNLHELSALPESDIRSVISLLSGITGITTNHLVLRRFLLDGLSKLIQADKWAWVHLGKGVASGNSLNPKFLHSGFSETELRDIIASASHPDAELLNPFFRNEELRRGGQITLRLQDCDPNGLWLASPSGILATAAGAGTFIMTISPKDAYGGSCMISLYRKPGAPHFSEEEFLIAHLVFSETAWLHNRGWKQSRISSVTSNLRPCLLPLYELLLDGSSRKEISESLGITVNTVNSYTKEIYRHFGVHSQPELMRIHIRVRTDGPG